MTTKLRNYSKIETLNVRVLKALVKRNEANIFGKFLKENLNEDAAAARAVGLVEFDASTVENRISRV